jgi:hypothetical protein
MVTAPAFGFLAGFRSLPDADNLVDLAEVGLVFAAAVFFIGEQRCNNKDTGTAIMVCGHSLGIVAAQG